MPPNPKLLDSAVLKSKSSFFSISMGRPLASSSKFSMLADAHKNLDDDAKGLPILIEKKEDFDLSTALSNSFGFGGTNACVVFESLND